MGTTARLLVRGGAPEALDRAEDSLHGLEAKWSRFRPETELSLLNAAGGGRPVVVSAVTFALISRAVDAWRRTGGAFDPTGLAAIRAWGYDRDFAEVASEQADAHDLSHPFGGCADIELDPTVRAVTLPRGVTLDLGGIGKGYAADLISEELVAAGAIAVCVDLGGDLRVRGPGPYDAAWEVEFDDSELALKWGRIRFDAGAVATSTRLRRRWRRGAREVHHLLDPFTGSPAMSGLASVTVVAADAWWAEVMAKAAFVLGATAGKELLESGGVDGILVSDAGELLETRGMAQYRSGVPRSGTGTRSS
jgi:thiamine biosynthesis lipoprotein